MGYAFNTNIIDTPALYYLKRKRTYKYECCPGNVPLRGTTAKTPQLPCQKFGTPLSNDNKYILLITSIILGT